MANPYNSAQRLIDELGINERSDLELLEQIAWERGALITEKKLDGAEARIVMAGRKAIITISSTIDNPHRRRFSIVHELGHLEMHRQEKKLALCTNGDMDDWASRRSNMNLEQEANEFASVFLMPDKFFAPLCEDGEPSLNLIADLAEKFNTSLTATALRYIHFAIDACAIVYSKDGRIKWFRGNKEFDELGLFVDVRSKLDPDSMASKYFLGRSLPDRQRSVPASAWLVSGRYRQDATIREQSWPMPRYNSVLTLLWVDDDIEDNEFNDGDDR